MNFSFYMVDTDYCDYLRESDPRVPYTMERKSIRPFVGIVFSVHNVHYYAPLTSPKPNFNNMIPVHPGSLRKVEIKILETDSQQNIAYKNLLSNQLSWCNSNRSTILKQAEKLYRLIAGGNAWDTLVNRCCNFVLDEKLCEAYARENFEP